MLNNGAAPCIVFVHSLSPRIASGPDLVRGYAAGPLATNAFGGFWGLGVCGSE